MDRDARIQAEPGAWLYEPGRVILDTRSPGECAKGHIPGAYVFSMFEDDERAVIGTLYKHQGQEKAIEKGLEMVGPKMADFVRRSRKLFEEQAFPKPLIVHCWRGGMRSGAIAWLLETAGLPVVKISGGYKAYRSWVRDGFKSCSTLRMLGGMTGVGKTPILHALSAQGAQVLDLEGIADHLGSAFGNLERLEQPSSEQFSNDCHRILTLHDSRRPIWVEDESRVIGTVHLPEELFEQMCAAPMVEVLRSEEERIDQLCQVYGGADRSALQDAFRRIEDKLGGERCKAAVKALEADDLRTAAAIGLVYYDRLYKHTVERYARPQRTVFDGRGLSLQDIAAQLIAQD